MYQQQNHITTVHKGWSDRFHVTPKSYVDYIGLDFVMLYWPLRQYDRTKYFSVVQINDTFWHREVVKNIFCILWKHYQLEMRAIAHRDGHPAEYMWRPLFNAVKFGWRPLLECHAVSLARCETRWNLQGCPKLPDRSQPLVDRSSPYCGDMCRRYAA